MTDKRRNPNRTQYQIKTEPPYRFLTAVPQFEWRTPWSTPPTQMGAKSKQFGAAHIAGIGVTQPPTQFITAVPKFEWRQPWSTPPTRMGPISRMVGAALIAATGLFAPVFTPPTTLDMDWLTPLSTPTPAKRGLPTHQQQALAFTPENFPSCGLVGVDSEGTALVGGSSVNTIDYTGITVGDGPNRALVALAQTDTPTGGMAAVWDQGGTNQAMTLIGTTQLGPASQTVAIFGLLNPVGGNNTLRFSWTTAGFPTVTAISLLTVDQSSDANAFQNYQHNNGNVASLSVTVPSKPGDLVVGIGCAAGPTVTAVGDNSIYIDNTSVGNHSGAGYNTGAASVTFTGTGSVPGNWLLGAINVSAYPCPVDTDFILPLSEVPRRKAALHPSQQDASTPDVFQTTEIITVDKWFDALSEPARVKQNLRVSDQGYVPLVTEVVTVDKWFDALSGPVLARRGLNAALQVAYTAEYFPDTPNANAGLWLGSFAEPLRVKSRFSALQAVFTIGYSPETIGQWFNPLSEPARTKRSLNTPDQSWVPFITTETVTVDKWFDAFSEPVRTKPALKAALQSVSTQDTIFIPNPSRYEGWFGGLAEPVRQKASLSVAQQTAFFAPLTVTSFVTGIVASYDGSAGPSFSWRLIYRTKTEPVFVPATITADQWYAPLSLPVRQKLGLNTAIQSTYTTGYPSLEIISVDKWYAALSDPKRFRPALHVSLQQTITQDTVFIPSPSRYEGWYGALSEPQRQKATAQQPTTVVPLTTTEVVTVDKWFNSYADVVRKKVPTDDRYLGQNNWTAIAASMEWFTPLAEPVRQKIGLHVSQQQTLAYVTTIASTEVITVDKWFKSYADPVRTKHPADDRYQGENNWEAIAASMEWFAPFTEPVRTKPGLIAATRPPYAVWPNLIIIPSLASWWRPLAEPPKAKVSLSTHLQQAFTQDPKLFPNPARFLEGWYNWFSEPVRHLAQLNAALQRSWTASDRRPVLATVTVTMVATEINDDVALFAVKVLAGNPPVTAVVSLVEIGHGASLTSIVEEGDDGSGTSVVET